MKTIRFLRRSLSMTSATLFALTLSIGVASAQPVCDGDCRAAMLKLAYLADLSAGIEGKSDEQASAITQRRLACMLNENPSDANTGWKVVWGPFVTMEPGCDNHKPTTFSANAMFVAQYKETNTYAIAVAGTNPESNFEWLKEDFDHSLVPWPYGPESKCKSWKFRDRKNVCLARGTWTGLGIVQGLGSGTTSQTIDRFIKSVVKKVGPEEKLTLYVTGHSLGGALAPTVALWLNDIQLTWDPEQQATLQVFAFAGPTPGSQGFADYLNGRFQGDAGKAVPTENGLTVVNNNFDVVPHAFKSLRALPEIYSKVNIFPGPGLAAFIETVADSVDKGQFETLGKSGQIKDIEGELQPAEKLRELGCPSDHSNDFSRVQFSRSCKKKGGLPSLNRNSKCFLAEGVYQHVDAYPIELGISPDFSNQLRQCACKYSPDKHAKGKC